MIGLIEGLISNDQVFKNIYVYGDVRSLTEGVIDIISDNTSKQKETQNKNVQNLSKSIRVREEIMDSKSKFVSKFSKKMRNPSSLIKFN